MSNGNALSEKAEGKLAEDSKQLKTDVLSDEVSI
jgi:hypothetical protein